MDTVETLDSSWFRLSTVTLLENIKMKVLVILIEKKKKEGERMISLY